jgi:hypothetical protein
VEVPGDVRLDGVHAHGLQAEQAVVPVLRRHSAVVQGGGYDLEWLGVKVELVVGDGERPWGGACCCACDYGGDDE